MSDCHSDLSHPVTIFYLHHQHSLRFTPRRTRSFPRCIYLIFQLLAIPFALPALLPPSHTLCFFLLFVNYRRYADHIQSFAFCIYSAVVPILHLTYSVHTSRSLLWASEAPIHSAFVFYCLINELSSGHFFTLFAFIVLVSTPTSSEEHIQILQSQASSMEQFKTGSLILIPFLLSNVNP